MKSILIVDDEKNYLVLLDMLFGAEGYEVVTTADPRRALVIVDEDPPGLVITDMNMPGTSGMDVLRAVKSKRPDLPVIMLTAFGTVEAAVQAMKEGAYHYILKPFDNEEMKLIVKRAFERSDLEEEKRLLAEEVSARFAVQGFVAGSPAMEKVSALIESVAGTKTTVLIQGESGTGKELAARAIHARSPRRDKPFVAVHCGALTATLLESELFGHEKGAFTGASARKKGRFEMADGGTLFLDEVGTTPPELQVKLLRVLQEQSFERVGGTKTIKSDVRVIAATNSDLTMLKEQGVFREDLYFRLKVFTIDMPALRDRRGDIPGLATHFVSLFARELGKVAGSISKEAMAMLESYQWPGNIRELKNVIERAVVVSSSESIGADDLPLDVSGKTGPKAMTTASSRPLPEVLEDIERDMIMRALKEADNVQAKAARLLGISPTNLQYKLNKYGLI